MIGDAVGIIAAQSIGEPGTQLTMRTFHTGGVAGADITHGLPRVVELFEARKPKGLAKIAEVGGVVSIEDTDKARTVVITDDAGEEHRNTFPRRTRLHVAEGEKIEPGTQLNEGSLYPHELLELRGRTATEVYLVKEVQEVYKSQGVDINDKHIELIGRQMLKKVRIDQKGDTDLLPGPVRGPARVAADQRQGASPRGGEPAQFEEIILGITKASLATDSFLSAASFQETTKVLTDAALEGKIDRLAGLKENVIIGKLIPAATGLKRYRTIEIEPTEPLPARHRRRRAARGRRPRRRARARGRRGPAGLRPGLRHRRARRDQRRLRHVGRLVRRHRVGPRHRRRRQALAAVCAGTPRGGLGALRPASKQGRPKGTAKDSSCAERVPLVLNRFFGLKAGALGSDECRCPGQRAGLIFLGLNTHLTLNLGILLALACAVATQLGFLYKHRGANAAPQGRHPPSAADRAGRCSPPSGSRSAWASRSAPGSSTSPRSRCAPLSVVQAVLSTGVVMLAVLADRLFGFEVGRRQWLGVAMTAVGLVLLVITLPGQPRRALELLARRHARVRGRDARDRRAAHHAARAWAPRTTTTGSCSAPPPASCSVSPTSPSRRSPASTARSRSSLSPWLGVAAPRLGRRLLRLRARPAGRRGRPGHRLHLHGRQRVLHHRRHRRLRRPDALGHARHRCSRSSPSRS